MQIIERNQIWTRCDGGPYDGTEVKIEGVRDSMTICNARIIYSKVSDEGKGPRTTLTELYFRKNYQPKLAEETK